MKNDIIVQVAKKGILYMNNDLNCKKKTPSAKDYFIFAITPLGIIAGIVLCYFFLLSKGYIGNSPAGGYDYFLYFLITIMVPIMIIINVLAVISGIKALMNKETTRKGFFGVGLAIAVAQSLLFLYFILDMFVF